MSVRRICAIVAAVSVALLLPGNAQAADPVQLDSTSFTTSFAVYGTGDSAVVINCTVYAQTAATSSNFRSPDVVGSGWLACSGPADSRKIITDSNVTVLLANLTTGTGEWSPATACGNAPNPGSCQAHAGPLTCDANSSGYCGDHFRTRTTGVITTNQDIDPGSVSDKCELLNSKTMQCVDRNGGVVV